MRTPEVLGRSTGSRSCNSPFTSCDTQQDDRADGGSARGPSSVFAKIHSKAISTSPMQHVNQQQCEGAARPQLNSQVLSASMHSRKRIAPVNRTKIWPRNGT